MKPLSQVWLATVACGQAARPSLGALFFLGLTSAVAIACGESKPEAKAPETPAPTESAPPPPAASSVAETPPPAETVATPAPAASSAPAVAAAPAGPKFDKNGVPLDEKDECTPVGADFEKRARPKLKECYAEGKKKDKELQGSVKIKISVDMKGKIKSTKVIEKTLPEAVAQCMVKAVQNTPFPEVDKCWNSQLTIPITFPTPR